MPPFKSIHFEITRDGEPTRTLTFNAEIELVSIGRSSGNHIVLADDQVSRQHAVVVHNGGRFVVDGESAPRRATASEDAEVMFIRDLSSQHGTRVDGAAVIQVDLYAGSKIAIGPFLLELSLLDEDASLFQSGRGSGPSNAGTVPVVNIPKALEPVRALVQALAQTQWRFFDYSALFDWLTPRAVSALGADIGAAWLELADGSSHQVGKESMTGLPAGATERAMQGGSVAAEDGLAFVVPIHNEQAEVIGYWGFERDHASGPFGPGAVALVGALTGWAIKHHRPPPARMNAARSWPMHIVGFGTAHTRRMARSVKPLAEAEVRILLFGETGTGKSAYAREIHRRSQRSEGPFIVAASAVGSEATAAASLQRLVGSWPGFEGVGARGVIGALEEADGGIVFLDEIATYSAPAQNTLLIPLQGVADAPFEVPRLGAPPPGQRNKTVSVRVIAATHENLRAKVASGEFNEALFRRVSEEIVDIPPLRERPDDIPILVHFILDRLAAAHASNPVPRTVARDALEALRACHWGENVGGLEKCVYAAFTMHEQHPVLLREDFNIPTDHVEPPSDFDPWQLETIAEHEEWALEKALERTGGNITHSAKLLQCSESTVRTKMDALKIPRPYTPGRKSWSWRHDPSLIPKK